MRCLHDVVALIVQPLAESEHCWELVLSEHFELLSNDGACVPAEIFVLLVSLAESSLHQTSYWLALLWGSAGIVPAKILP